MKLPWRLSVGRQAFVGRTATAWITLVSIIIAYIAVGHTSLITLYKLLGPLSLIDGIPIISTNRPVGDYIRKADQVVTRLVIIGLAAQLIVLIITKRGRVLRFVSKFCHETTSPLNLAIFRIVFFSVFFCSVISSDAAWFNDLPRALRIAPIGLDSIVSRLPTSQTPVRAASLILEIACIAGIVGFCSRTAALVATLLGIYVLGIPNFYGKVNHYHHLIWFSAILAFSSCDDVLSVTARIRTWQRRRKNLPPVIYGPSLVYADPLRWIWLLFGVIYFFPGFWKLWDTGPEFLFGDNLRYILQQKWFELNGWLPLIRIDRFPLLCRLMAMTSILFEISFPFLILSPRTRTWIALVGLAFHNGTALLMRINFWNLQALYVVFFDWAKLLALFGFARARSEGETGDHADSRRHVSLELVGGGLFVANVVLGFTGICNAWPLACYPTFAFREGPTCSKIEFVALLPAGQSVSIVDGFRSQKMSSERWAAMSNAAVQSKSRDRLGSIWRKMVDDDRDLSKASRVKVYRSEYLIDPDLAARSTPVERKMILEFVP